MDVFTLSPSGKHIVEEYQWKLIASTHAVEKVVALLSADVLNPEQYWSIMASRSDQEKMYKLYELVPLWDTRHKDELFWAVKAAGPFLRRRCGNAQNLEQDHFRGQSQVIPPVPSQRQQGVNPLFITALLDPGIGFFTIFHVTK